MEATSVYGYMIRAGLVRYRSGTECGEVDASVGRPPRAAGDQLTAWCELTAVNGGLRAVLRLRNGLGLPVEILDARLETNLVLSPSTRVFANGWQSASASGSVRIGDGLSRPFLADGPALSRGDYGFAAYGPGRVHSWTFTWFGGGDDFSWLGALDESLAFARFEFSALRGGRGLATLSVRADCDGLVLPPAPRTKGAPQEPVRILDVFLVRGEEQACIDGYFDLRRRARIESGVRRTLPRGPAGPALAWIGRGGASSPVGEAEVAAAAEPFRLLDVPPDFLFVGTREICAVSARPSAASGVPPDLRVLFEAVRRTGALPGVALSPFVCSEASDLYRERKEYLALDLKGRPIRTASARPGEKPLYVMDFYGAPFRRHLETVFRGLVADGGVGVLRLEDLHAAALLGGTGRGRTRAQAMQDALRLLQDLCRSVPFVAADIPLGAAFDSVGFASVAPEPRPSPAGPFARLAARGLRERADREAAVRTLLGRRHLDGRAFRADPGPFTLRRARDPSEESSRIRHFQACTLFGGLLSTADALSAYSSLERERFREAVRRRGSRLAEKRVRAVEEGADGSFRVTYELRGEPREEDVPPPAARSRRAR